MAAVIICSDFGAQENKVCHCFRRCWHNKPDSQVKKQQLEPDMVRDFILGGSKITTDDDCSHEIKRCLLLGRKAMTKLGKILKSRDITLLTKFCLVKAMVFPVVMYGCESWTIKKLSIEELVLLNCGVGEEGDPTSSS